MNLSIRFLGALALFSCFAVSCKKDKDDNNNPNQTRLSKMLQWNTGTPAKGIITTEFIYDDQKRVVEIATFSGDSVGGEIRSAKIRSLKFLYNGNKQNSYKTIGLLPYSSSPTAEIFHKYNSNGALVQDSTPTPSSYYTTSLRNYSYGTDKIILNMTMKDSWGYIYQSSKDSIRLANSNLSEAYVGTFSYPYNAYKITYDDKINPLSKLNIASVFPTTSINGFPTYLAPGSCKNNITEYAYGTSTGQGQFTANNVYYYTYFYNRNNLPEECRYTSGGINYTIRFEYKE